MRIYAFDPATLDRAADHGCIDEDVSTGDLTVCERCAS